MQQRQAVVCAGDAGIHALATVRSLGRRGVPVHVFALKASRQIASHSRYCRASTLVDSFDDLCTSLLDFARQCGQRPVPTPATRQSATGTRASKRLRNARSIRR